MALIATLLLIVCTLVLLFAIHKGTSRIMSQLDDLISALNTETNTIAAKIDKLGAELIAAQQAGQAPTAAQLASLSAISDRLKALGADPAAPIPTAPPTP